MIGLMDRTPNPKNLGSSKTRSSVSSVLPQNEAWDPSVGGQVGDNIALVDLKFRCVKNSFTSNSIANRRHRAVYAHLREIGREVDALIARLIQVTCVLDANMTHYYFE